jgi:hypothetical protein
MPENRKSQRVAFGRGIPSHLMAIDGTWRRTCLMLDISDSGAKLQVQGPLKDLNKEFFLLMSSTGLPYRHCELIWINGEQVGVSFIKPGTKKSAVKPSARSMLQSP